MSQKPVRLSLVIVTFAACSGYEATVQPIRQSLSRGNVPSALTAVNKQLGVKTAKDRPSKFKNETALLLLERAMILQALGRFEEASPDLEEAEKHLELLDLSKDTAGNIGKYLYSDDATAYKAPVYEKLMLSTENLLNYLARGDLNGARIESRRLTVMQNYLRDEVGPDKAKFGLGSYLAGFAFEKSGRPEEALRYYDEALQAQDYRSLEQPVARLAQQTSFRTPRIQAILNRVSSQPIAPESGEILVVLQNGLVPRKEPERIPVGLAFAIAYDVTHPRYAMTPAQRGDADKVMAKSLLKWINFPSLTKDSARTSPGAVQVNGHSYTPEPALDVSARVREAYEAIKPLLVVSAVTRMVARAIAGELTGYGVGKASGSGVLGLLAGLAVEGAMSAKDTPDTRSWTTLPAQVAVVRVPVPAGTNRVDAQFGSAWGPLVHRAAAEVPAGGFRVLTYFEPR